MTYVKFLLGASVLGLVGAVWAGLTYWGARRFFGTKPPPRIDEYGIAACVSLLTLIVLWGLDTAAIAIGDSLLRSVAQ